MDSLINLSTTYETRKLEELTKPFILPVTIVTGFLGAGKTTLLKNLLAKKRNLRIATLVNDFGSFSHDVQLLTTQLASAAAATVRPDRMMDLHGNCLCCSHLTNEMRQGVWEVLQVPDGADYLVIETSGVTDPQRIINILDEKFGKMTRARLDSVVTVVDTDVVAAECLTSFASDPVSHSVALRSQLQCADVIILNKVDLVEQERVDAVERFLTEINPLARIHRTTYANVPLLYVLDVELPDGGPAQMTHETGSANYMTRAAKQGQQTLRSDSSKRATTSSTNLLTGQPKNLKDASPASSAQQPHLTTDALFSCTFESNQPFILHRLQTLFSILPDSVVRMKGFIQLREVPGRRILLNMSGRRRFHVEDEGVWASAPRTQLVVIGRGEDDFDVPLLTKALEYVCDGNVRESSEEEAAAASIAAHLRRMVAADGRMELVDSAQVLDLDGALSPPLWAGRLVAFRLTGAPSLGVTSEHLRLQHGLDLDELGLALQQRVNMHGGRSVVLLHALPCPKDGKEGLILCFSVDDKGGQDDDGSGKAAKGFEYFTQFWSFVSEQADGVVRQYMSHLKLCKCGH